MPYPRWRTPWQAQWRTAALTVRGGDRRLDFGKGNKFKVDVMSAGITLDLRVEGTAGVSAQSVMIENLVIAGWTGRNAKAIEHHIAELEAIGAPRPTTVPCFYRAAASLLTTADTIQSAGPDSSGEVEFIFYGTKDGMLVGVASDHTDRKVETYSIVVSKQMCFKPISPAVWRFADVAGHWDDLLLRSWAEIGGERRLYQEGPVTAMKPPGELFGLYLDGAAEVPDGMAMFCGTLAVQGGVEAAEKFEIEIEDPVLGPKIRHGYAIEALPIVA